MSRRAVWFVGGAAAGASGAVYVKRKVTKAVDRVVDTVRPSNVASSATGAVRRAGHRVTEAVREGVTAARRRERELKAERDGRLVRLGDYLSDGDEVIVDGEPVESARVIVMRQRQP
ncbi:hypothetical protein [Desertimonas flava]|jgi:hypothetical protein|uniref:hypothetical protein n=1 Tax=Desertimonas flava TaxID=2064846 RepID=UPI000E34A602|nr:hypothetical protein [Desertimonas flava]